jgi:ATP-binding cassette subfamily B protein
MTKRPQMTIRQQMIAVWNVSRLAYSISKLAVAFKIFGALLNSILPLVTTYFAALTTTELVGAYNGVPGSQEKVIEYVIITTLFGLLSMVWSTVDQYVQQVVRYKIESTVSDMMYEKFAALDFWRYDDKETADLYDKAKSFSGFFAWIFDRLASILQSFITMATAIIAIAYVTPWLSLLLLVAVIPGLAIQLKLSRAQVKHWNTHVDLRRKRGNIEWKMMMPNYMAELRIYGAVKHLLSMRQELREKDEKGRIEFERKYIGWRLLGNFVEAVAEIIALVWVVLLIASRQQPLGQFIFVQQIVSRILSSASTFVSQLSTIDEDVANLQEYDMFMQLATSAHGTKKVPDGPITIEFKDVEFSYPNASKKVLKGISLRIPTGSHVAIVGENGAGKSTMIKLLLGLYRPTKGKVLLGGEPLETYDLIGWHKRLGVLMQDFITYDFATVGENVWFGDVSRTYDKSAVQDALMKGEAADIVAELTSGLDTPASTYFEDEEGVQLSGGQWQRIALARNFFRKADITILDEPTSAIDALAEAKIFKTLFAKSNHKTVITISHRLSTVEKADIIYVIAEGKVAESGTHKELAAHDGEYRRLFAEQL